MGLFYFVAYNQSCTVTMLNIQKQKGSVCPKSLKSNFYHFIMVMSTNMSTNAKPIKTKKKKLQHKFNTRLLFLTINGDTTIMCFQQHKNVVLSMSKSFPRTQSKVHFQSLAQRESVCVSVNLILSFILKDLWFSSEYLIFVINKTKVILTKISLGMQLSFK